MEWKSIKAAAEAWAGGVHTKHLYSAIKRGQLKAARYGPAGRNMLTCEAWINDWLAASAERGDLARTTAGDVVALRPPKKHVG